jgi:serine/threonine protein kinase
LALIPGTRLGPYEILSALGAGGMGEVYRASDTTLKRQVAIKILPPAVAGDVDRLARFQREAELLASLNHPNIAAIYGMEESEGVKALAMELVEGDDLSQRIARRALPIDEALPIARQIAEPRRPSRGIRDATSRDSLARLAIDPCRECLVYSGIPRRAALRYRVSRRRPAAYNQAHEDHSATDRHH